MGSVSTELAMEEKPLSLAGMLSALFKSKPSDGDADNGGSSDSESSRKPTDAPVSSAPSANTSDAAASAQQSNSKSIPLPDKSEEIKSEITTEEIRNKFAAKARDVVHMLGYSGEVMAQAMNEAANMAQFSRGALDITKVAITAAAKATGIPEGIVNAAREAAQGINLMCNSLSRDTLCTMSSPNANMTKQPAAGITPPGQ